jgi:hypothetical protein
MVDALISFLGRVSNATTAYTVENGLDDYPLTSEVIAGRAGSGEIDFLIGGLNTLVDVVGLTRSEDHLG